MDILIYGDIGENWWTDPEEAITARNIAKQLATVPTSEKTVDVRINTLGGSCGEGLAIKNQLRDFALKRRLFDSDFQIRSIVDGYSYSAGTIIMLGGDKIIMNTGTMAMIHRAAMMSFGNTKTLAADAAYLQKMDENIADLYSAKSGKKAGEMLNLMDNETFLNPDEALALGLIDEVSAKYTANFGNFGDLYLSMDKGAYEQIMAKRLAEATRSRVRKKASSNSGGSYDLGFLPSIEEDELERILCV